MVYLLPCYHKDKLGKHLISCPIFLSYSPQQLYFSHLFPPLTFIIFYPLPPFRLSALPLVRVCVVCADPWKVGSSNHKPERSTFSLRWNERNEHFWMKWSRTLHSNPNFFFSPPPLLSPSHPSSCMVSEHQPYCGGGGHSRSLVTSIISEDRFLTLSASVPFWHQGLPLKLFIAHHVAYIRLRCSCVEIL